MSTATLSPATNGQQDLFDTQPVAPAVAPIPKPLSTIRVRLSSDGILNLIKPTNAIWTQKEYVKLSMVPGRRARGHEISAFPSPILGEWLDSWDVVDAITQEAADVCRQLIEQGRSFKMVRDAHAEFEAGTFVFDDIPENPEFPLPPYQKFAATMLRRVNSYGLFMEQGTGKTYTCLAALESLVRDHLKTAPTRQFRTLVICPAQVMTNWAHEIEKFFPDSLAQNVCVMRGQKFNRVHDLIDTLTHPSRSSICIVSYDTMKRITETLKTVKWDVVIPDESHYFKDQSADRTAAMLLMRECSGRRWILTGTPVNNKPADLFTQMEFMGEGMSGCSSPDDFRRNYGDRLGAANGTDAAFDTLLRIPALKQLLSGCSLRVRKKDVLKDLPPIASEIIDVEMSPEQNKVYTKMRDELAAQLDEIVSNAPNANMAVNNILVKLLRLAQITSGFAIATDEDEIRVMHEFDPNPKMNMLCDMLGEWLRPMDSENPNKLIIWSCFIPDCKRIFEVCTELGLHPTMLHGQIRTEARDEAVRRFNYDDTCRVLVGNPAAGGVGVNLLGNMGPRKMACDGMIYYAMNWSYAVHAQSLARAHRRGTTASQLRVGYLRVPGSIDTMIGKRLESKSDTAFSILDAKAALKKDDRRTVYYDALA